MENSKSIIALKKEQQATLERPRYKYSLAAKIFFNLMDVVTGKKITLSKVKLIETLASIPYRSWEIRQYSRLTRFYNKNELVMVFPTFQAKIEYDWFVEEAWEKWDAYDHWCWGIE